ncbi:hypothetical protein A2818_00915 [Candidatus Nomurabacteria bacterium RIFCSPHIGHO2_01_FULL_40_12]|uniref:BIG2 domain-containing protein n=1 Tax=Candidatus Nomurabacteria bacterium RIFCSPHIGHO2_01_FULL_40_12 TaxID=1801737 RepID=A0A1F6UZI8_9BACT|nr:MAG: hypothetical protein A2818_00915 [Candidatus Nomurabacteria bacterium RIFCSPHIGHO2_01_FULL_40_12]
MTRTLSFVVMLAMVASACGESSNPTAPTQNPSVVVSSGPTLMRVEASATVNRMVMGGQCRQTSLTAVYSDGDGNTSQKDVTREGKDWTSSDSNIVDVDTRGMSCPASVGSAQVTGVYEGRTSTAVSFTVAEPTPTQPPRAVDDPYFVKAGEVLNVPAPGVLANDTYPAGATVEFLPPFPPGTFSNTGGGGFRLDFGGATGVLRFRYVIKSSAGDSNSATVSVTIESVSPTARISGIVYGRQASGPPLPIEGIVVIPDGNLRVTDVNGRYGPVTIRLTPDGDYGVIVRDDRGVYQGGTYRFRLPAGTVRDDINFLLDFKR